MNVEENMIQLNFQHVSSVGMECEACDLPFQVSEHEISPPVFERLVECRCPECGHLVANISTEHDLIVSTVH